MPSSETPIEGRPPNRLAFRLQGKPEDAGLVRVSDFVVFLESVAKSLRYIESDLGYRRGAVFRVSNLGVGSAVIELEAVPRKGLPDRTPRIVGTFVETLGAVQAGRDPPVTLSPRTIESFKGLVEPLKGSVVRIEVDSQFAHVEVTRALGERIEQLLTKGSAEMGTESGYVDALNVHEDLVFYLYPGIVPGKIACYFPRGLLDEVRASIKRYVTVSGAMLYAGDSVTPHRVDVDALRIHPPVSQLPSGRSLMGIAPGLTGGLESTEYVRRLRDAET